LKAHEGKKTPGENQIGSQVPRKSGPEGESTTAAEPRAPGKTGGAGIVGQQGEESNRKGFSSKSTSTREQEEGDPRGLQKNQNETRKESEPTEILNYKKWKERDRYVLESENQAGRRDLVRQKNLAEKEEGTGTGEKPYAPRGLGYTGRSSPQLSKKKANFQERRRKS